MQFIDQALIWTEERVFISPAYGCPARCAFCYLPEVGLNQPAGIFQSAEMLASRLVSDLRFRPGLRGTVLSLGCLSETLAPHAIKATLAFLKSVQGIENPLQIATRWCPNITDTKDLLNALRHFQGVVFHSMVEWGARKFETGTLPESARTEFIKKVANAGVPSVLYLKPFLAGHTINHMPAFLKLAHTFEIQNAVLGTRYISRSACGGRAGIKNDDYALEFTQPEFPVGASARNKEDRATVYPPDVLLASHLLEDSKITVNYRSIDAIQQIYGID